MSQWADLADETVDDDVYEDNSAASIVDTQPSDRVGGPWAALAEVLEPSSPWAALAEIDVESHAAPALELIADAVAEPIVPRIQSSSSSNLQVNLVKSGSGQKRGRKVGRKPKHHKLLEPICDNGADDDDTLLGDDPVEVRQVRPRREVPVCDPCGDEDAGLSLVEYRALTRHDMSAIKSSEALPFVPNVMLDRFDTWEKLAAKAAVNSDDREKMVQLCGLLYSPKGARGMNTLSLAERTKYSSFQTLLRERRLASTIHVCAQREHQKFEHALASAQAAQQVRLLMCVEIGRMDETPMASRSRVSEG